MCEPLSVLAGRREDELRAGLERRDPCALTEIDRRHRERLRRHARRLLAGTGVDADDLVQDAILRAWTHPPAEGTALGAWLHAVLRNRGIDLLRSPAVSRRPASGVPADLPGRRDALGEAVAREDLRELVAAVRALPARQSQALVMHALEGRRHAQIASDLATTRAGAKVLVHRGRAELRRRIPHG